MQQTAIARQGDTLDALIHRHTARTQGNTEATLAANPGLADLGAVEGLYRHAESSLAALGTLDPARPRRLMARLRHLFGRTSLTAAEVDLLRGICRDIDRRTKGAQSAATGSAMPSAKDMT